MSKVLRACLLIFILASWSLSIFAAEPTQTYCQVIYGHDADLTYEPIDANGIGVADNFTTRKSTIIKAEGAPNPTGFMCQILLKSVGKKKCPEGMHVDTKRIKKPVCITKKLPLRELCPNEIAEVWPEIKDKICNKSSSKK